MNNQEQARNAAWAAATALNTEIFTPDHGAKLVANHEFHAPEYCEVRGWPTMAHDEDQWVLDFVPGWTGGVLVQLTTAEGECHEVEAHNAAAIAAAALGLVDQ